jgi:hypothetical protein
LDCISFDEEKEKVSLYYDDADLFAGHMIQLLASYDGKVLKVDL